jgi:DNA modification methylase
MMSWRAEHFLGGRVSLYLGDCREIVPSLAERCAAVVTDPPYRLTSGGSRKTPGSMRGGWMWQYNNKGAPVECEISWDEVAAVCVQALGEHGDVYLMANDKNLIPAANAAFAHGLQLHNILVWDKNTATANRWYMKNCEHILYLYRGRARKINDCSAKALIRCPQADETSHPTEKPVALMAHYIANSTQPGERVGDPFLGSGTTGVACVQLGRAFTGIEIERKWFDFACGRIAAALRAPPLFAPTAARASENMSLFTDDDAAGSASDA